MNYSPKLKMAMAELSAIMEKYDIAGCLVIHTPGHAEYKWFLEPSYSAAKIQGGELRIRLTTEQLRTEEGSRKLTETANMVASMIEPMYNFTTGLLDLSEKLDIRVIHTQPVHTAHDDSMNPSPENTQTNDAPTES